MCVYLDVLLSFLDPIKTGLLSIHMTESLCRQ